MKQFIEKIKSKENLSFEESKEAFELLMEGKAEDGIRDIDRSRGLGDVYKRQFLILIKFFKILIPNLVLILSG